MFFDIRFMFFESWFMFFAILTSAANPHQHWDCAAPSTYYLGRAFSTWGETSHLSPG